MNFIRPEEDIETPVASLERIAALEAQRLVLFASSGRLVENGCKALEECPCYIRALSRKVENLQAQGRTVQEIRYALFGSEHPRAQRTSGQFTTENLIGRC